MACIILGLEYCHTNNVVHRDIKPENLVLDSKGYVKITDFGVAKVTHNKIVGSTETSGTPGYMAPEVMCSQNHSYAVDYFALGIIGYEFMNGKRPYLGKNRKEIKEKIMARQAQVKIEDKPSEWSVESVDCINRLLQRKPHLRLGSRGAAEVKEHSWFKYYPWKDVYLRKYESPFIPRQGDNYDYKYCNKPDRIGLTTQERYIAIVNSPSYNTIFKEFYYFNRDEEENENENSNYNLRKFKNPHLVYYEKIEGNSNENDAAISNRNILRKAVDEQIYTEIKKNPGGGPFTLYRLYSNNNNKVFGKKNNSMSLSKGSIRNDSSMNNSSYRTNKKTSKASGFGY